MLSQLICVYRLICFRKGLSKMSRKLLRRWVSQEGPAIMGLNRLHDLMKEKLANASTSEKIQIMTLAPDSWSRDHCSKFFKVSEYIVRTARELKKVSGI